MKFSKSVMFLGMEESRFQDGKVMYAVSLYDVGGKPVTVNIMKDGNAAVIDSLSVLNMGEMVTLGFILRSAEKNTYRLGITSVT